MHKASDPCTRDGRLLTSKEVARLIGIKENTLRLWRSQGRGPRYLKAGDTPQSEVRYRASDVEAWVQEKVNRVSVETTQ